jgi:tRNA (guanine-N7-)-methyltransferase
LRLVGKPLHLVAKTKTETAEEGERRFYGRRMGHRLSPRRRKLVETLLPDLRVDLGAAPPQDLAELFSGPGEQVWLEIGFGAGEHLAWQAAHNPGVGILGCEAFMNGVANLLTSIESQALGNVRIHDGDARDLLDWLPDAGLDRIFMLFPDPWPKKRHQRRRLFSRATVAQFARVLRPGGEVRAATDIGDYARAMLLVMQQESAFEWRARRASDWRQRPSDWPQTRYEQKAIRERRTPNFLTFERL